MDLLDRFSTVASFQARTPTEFFAVRLAQKLEETHSARHYAELAHRLSEAQLLTAYQRALRSRTNGDLARRFHQELQHLHTNGHEARESSLIAIRVERRTVAAAVFQGRHLEYTDSRQLSSAHDRATSSVIAFISWMLRRFPVESAALEAIVNGNEIHRRVLHDAITAVLRKSLLAIWEIPRQALLSECAIPALRARKQLREIATSIWPILSGTHSKLFVQDAAMLGLHIQTERLFITN